MFITLITVQPIPLHGLLTGVTFVGTGDWVLDATVGRGTDREVVGIGTTINTQDSLVCTC